MSATFQDFELEISSVNRFEYFGKVTNSPGGQSDRCPLKFKFITQDPKDFDILRLTIENAVLRGSADAGRRGPASQPERVLRDFGGELFRSIFVDAGPIREAYARSKGALNAAGQNNLRMKLRIEPPDLASLPWEYLYDENETPNYIGLRLPVVRSIDMLGAAGQMQVKGPLRILGMIANPATPEWPRLDESAERRRIAEGIDKLQRDGRVVFEWVAGGTGTDLLSKLMENEWHIFHFIGHGGVEERSGENGEGDGTKDTGFIVLIDEYGRPVKKFASDLAVLLETPHRSLRLAVLNCCDSAKASVYDRFGSPAIALMRSGIPAVVAMQFPVGDKAAIRLAEGFYKSLANNLPVDAAVTMARKFIKNDSNVEWAIPVLFMRTPDGKIFEVDNPNVNATDPDSQLPASSPPASLPPPNSAGAADKLVEFTRLAAAPRGPIADLEQLARLGRELVDRKKSDRALAAQVAQIYCDLGRMQLAHNDTSKAVASFGSAIEFDPTQPDYRIRRANLFARVGFYELALSDVDEAIKHRADCAEYSWIKGIVYTMVASTGGNTSILTQAIAAFTTAIKQGAMEPKYYEARAATFAELKQYPEALADIDRAISLSPENAELLAQRATIVQRTASNGRSGDGI